ncbi:acetate--CoA ligase [Candidatus Fermentibacteria bacterium]|nr:acetate--CoA ligase [Candidatus Fermentibacteria bacterium]
MLDALFSPQAVAVVGASTDPTKLGHMVLDNIIKYGYQGEVHPINPKADEILGRTCYATVKDVPGPVDLAVIVVPNKFVAGVMNDCGEKGVGAAIVITAGFREAGPEGREMEQAVIEIARKYDIRVVGPNCLGVIDTHSALNASFAARMPDEGKISFMSQSGALCTGILDWAALNGLGFSSFVSLGNKGDLNETDFLEVWRDDPNTSVVMAYLEGVVDGDAFMEAARRLTKVKPFICVKSGTTSAGSRAVSSHTGTLAGSDSAYDAAFKQAGILRARSVSELFAYSTALAYQPLPKGRRVAIITNAGGPGIMATDACEKGGLQLATLSQETVDYLYEVLPPAANHYNPIDVLGDALSDRYEQALEAALKDPGVDAIIFLLTPQAMTEIANTAKAIVRISKNHDKPVLACFMGGKDIAAGNKILGAGHIPFYDFPEDAADALRAMVQQQEWISTEHEEPVNMAADRERAAMALLAAQKAGRLKLNEMEARQIVAAYGLPLPQSQLAFSGDQAAQFAAEIGYPVVMKIISPDILHKSDMGGVVVGIKDEKEARQAYQDILLRARRYMPDADIWGVAVQEMVAKGKEIILGVTKDPTFGHMVMFGLGGIYVEVLKDVQFAIAPITPPQAREMITSLRSYPLLAGVRGEPPSDMEAMVECLLRVSQMVTDLPQIVELDINPLFVYEKGQGVMAVDARIVISE